MAVRPVDDSFCVVYLPVIKKKGDSAIISPGGPREPKENFVTNEKTYKQLCGKKGA